MFVEVWLGLNWDSIAIRSDLTGAFVFQWSVLKWENLL